MTSQPTTSAAESTSYLRHLRFRGWWGGPAWRGGAASGRFWANAGRRPPQCAGASREGLRRMTSTMTSERRQRATQCWSRADVHTSRPLVAEAYGEKRELRSIEINTWWWNNRLCVKQGKHSKDRFFNTLGLSIPGSHNFFVRGPCKLLHSSSRAGHLT